MLGVGGGSVIDASKFLACTIAAGTDDPWDQLVADPDSVTPLPNDAILAKMGCPTSISGGGISLDKSKMIEHLERAGQTSLGERKDISPDEVRAILKLAV